MRFRFQLPMVPWKSQSRLRFRSASCTFEPLPCQAHFPQPFDQSPVYLKAHNRGPAKLNWPSSGARKSRRKDVPRGLAAKVLEQVKDSYRMLGPNGRLVFFEVNPQNRIGFPVSVSTSQNQGYPQKVRPGKPFDCNVSPRGSFDCHCPEAQRLQFDVSKGPNSQVLRPGPTHFRGVVLEEVGSVS